MNHARSTCARPAGIRLTAALLAGSLCLAMPGGPLMPSPARADGEGFKAIITNTAYGLACGLVLGGVLTLVVDKDDRGDVLRWGVVIGTFSGFSYGVYTASRDSGLFSAQPGADEARPSLLADGAFAGSFVPEGTLAIPGGTRHAGQRLHQIGGWAEDWTEAADRPTPASTGPEAGPQLGRRSW